MDSGSVAAIRALQPSWLQRWLGPLAMVVAVAALEGLQRVGWAIPNPSAVFVALAVLAVAEGGLGSGLVAGAVAMVYGIAVFPGQEATLVLGVRRIVVLGLTLAAVLAMTHWLRGRAVAPMERVSMAIARDLKQARQQGAEASHLAAVLEAIDEPVVGLTLGGTITSWNPAAHRLYGFAADETVGRSMGMLLPPGEGADLPRLLAHVGGGQQVRVRQWRQTKSGRLVHVDVCISPVRDPSGAVVGAASIARPVADAARGD